LRRLPVKKGSFITFEGGEGVGKTTQIEMLAEYLAQSGRRVHVTREPGGDEVGEKIRSVLKSHTVSVMDPLCETLLLFAARRDHYVKVISPLLELGYFVISDRFYDSTIVYQGALKNVSVEDIMALKRMTIGDFEPDLTIILDVDADISMRRLSERRLIEDVYDSMTKEKHNTIRKGFQDIASIFSFRAELINANESREKVFSKIVEAVKNSNIL
jgi:dTMP kinase